MHIAHVLSYIGEQYGGPPKVALGMSRVISASGVTVSCWATASPEDSPSLRANPAFHLLEAGQMMGGLHCAPLAHAMTREIGSIDVIHIHEIWLRLQYAASKVAGRNQVPCIITPHGGLEPWRIRRKGLLKYVKKATYLKLVGTRMLNEAACLHAVTPCEIAGFRQAGYRGAVTVVPNGIDVEKFSRLPDRQEAEVHWPELRGRRVVLFLSRLSSEKGLDEFLPAWGRVVGRSSYDDALLVLAGPDDRGYRSTVESLIARHDLGGHVVCTGIVSGSRKLSLVSRADGYVLPSHSEGFSVSLLENMAAGKAVLITPGCNFPEIARANAGLTVPCESAALAEGACALLDMSPKSRMEMGWRARNLILQDYTWDIVGRKMMTVYDCVVHGRPVPERPEPFNTPARTTESTSDVLAILHKTATLPQRTAPSNT
jgi:glycosyltransferase involved in cell wall biosynthesis